MSQTASRFFLGRGGGVSGLYMWLRTRRRRVMETLQWCSVSTYSTDGRKRSVDYVPIMSLTVRAVFCASVVGWMILLHLTPPLLTNAMSVL